MSACLESQMVRRRSENFSKAKRLVKHYFQGLPVEQQIIRLQLHSQRVEYNISKYFCMFFSIKDISNLLLL